MRLAILILFRSVKHHCLRVVVFGHSKTGKSTLIGRLIRKRERAAQWISKPTCSEALNIIEWVYAPTTADESVKFIMWDFDNQV